MFSWLLVSPVPAHGQAVRSTSLATGPSTRLPSLPVASLGSRRGTGSHSTPHGPFCLAEFLEPMWSNPDVQRGKVRQGAGTHPMWLKIGRPPEEDTGRLQKGKLQAVCGEWAALTAGPLGALTVLATDWAAPEGGWGMGKRWLRGPGLGQAMGLWSR